MRAAAQGLPGLTSAGWSPPAQDLAPAALQVDDALLLDVLTRCAALDAPDALAGAVLVPLQARPGVRAALLAEAPHRRADAVVLASTGYDCPSMDVGAVLPAASGLPVVEALRLGTPVVHGSGPGWVALPVPQAGGRRAALLLSLTCAPPADLTVLCRLAAALGPVLDRLRAGGAVGEEVAVLEEGLAVAPPEVPGLLVRSRPWSGVLSGDVVAREEVGGACWLLVADVSGRGAAAAVLADRLRAAFTAVLPTALSPAAVLRALDRAAGGGEERFATALVLRLAPGPVVAASAGHPAPLLRTAGRVEALPVPPGPPVGLGLDGPVWVDAPLGPLAGTLVAWTDGLLDRGREVDLPALLARAPRPGRPVAAGSEAALSALADALETGCDAVGPQQDDATLVLLELPAP